MRFFAKCQTSYAAADLLVQRSKALGPLVKKFNKKMSLNKSISKSDNEEPTIAKNEDETCAIDVDLAEAVDKAHDDWFKADKLDTIFAKQVRIDDE